MSLSVISTFGLYELDDPRLPASDERRSSTPRSPETLQLDTERFCLGRGVEVELELDVLSVVEWPEDSIRADPGLLALQRIRVECTLPNLEVADRVLDLQYGHESSFRFII
jgi:hypothetical protein